MAEKEYFEKKQEGCKTIALLSISAMFTCLSGFWGFYGKIAFAQNSFMCGTVGFGISFLVTLVGYVVYQIKIEKIIK